MPANQSDGVAVKVLGAEKPILATLRGINNHLRIGKVGPVVFAFTDGGELSGRFGVVESASAGTLSCGQPFLATPGHLYQITCSFIPSRASGSVTIELVDPATGKSAGTIDTEYYKAH